jgi:hypothetical protein
MAHNLSRWTARIGGLDTPDPAQQDQHDPTSRSHRRAFVATDTVRHRYLAIPGRIATSARRTYLHLPTAWPWATEFNHMLDAIRKIELVT